MVRVFIVDDQKTNRVVLAKLAGALRPSVQVHQFACPHEALSAASKTPPDLVVTDYKMPGMNGADFVRRVRQYPECADVPVIVVTAYDDRVFRYDALASGATDFLLSPVDHAEFKARAGNLLTLQRQQRIIRRRASILEAQLRSRTALQEEALRDSREKLRLVVNTVPAMISAIDRQGVCLYINNHQGLFFSVDPDKVAGQPLERIFDADYARRHRLLNTRIEDSGTGLQNIEERLLDTRGVEHVFLTTKAPLFSADNEISSIVTVSVDITERKQLESALWKQAHFDSLTSLPNRTLLHDRLGKALADSVRSRQMTGVFYVDLDGFKDINDAFGHSVGDAVLRVCAKRLGQRMRPADTLARLGGDELVAVVEGLEDRAQADAVAGKLLDALNSPVVTNDRSLQVRASIGIALSSSTGDTPEAVLMRADAALYQAKALGGNRWSYYTPELTAQAQRRIHLESMLRHALEFEPEQLGLAVQPIKDIRDWRTVGYEALVRWNHPEEGPIAPNEFLPIAEATGLMNWLGRMVLKSAAHWAVANPERLVRGRIAVNVSPMELASEHFLDDCNAILRETGLAPGKLELEITEGGLMRQDETAIERIETLRKSGVSIAIDDFGKGYSSLRYLKALPVDRLKIDRSFVSGLADDSDNRAIVKATLMVANHFGLGVVAEGLERERDVAALQRIGLRQVQGYYCGRPYLVGSFTDLGSSPVASPHPHPGQQYPARAAGAHHERGEADEYQCQ